MRLASDMQKCSLTTRWGVTVRSGSGLRMCVDASGGSTRNMRPPSSSGRSR